MSTQENQQLESAMYAVAMSVGVLVLRVQGGFMLICLETGEELAGDDEGYGAWSAADVIEYCGILREGAETGVYVI